MMGTLNLTTSVSVRCSKRRHHCQDPLSSFGKGPRSEQEKKESVAFYFRKGASSGGSGAQTRQGFRWEAGRQAGQVTESIPTTASMGVSEDRKLLIIPTARIFPVVCNARTCSDDAQR
ncbi:unnamed protein product [Sphagnum tenellum]